MCIRDRRAFRDQDADGDGDASNEIPYAVEDSGAMHTARPDIISGLFGLYSNFGYDNVQLVDGKVSFLKTDDNWKKVLEYMNVMYSEKLLDNEVFTQTSDMSIGKISSGNIGVFGLSSDDLFTTVSDNYVAVSYTHLRAPRTARKSTPEPALSPGERPRAPRRAAPASGVRG